MEAVQYTDSEKNARIAREKALESRFQNAPLPGSLPGSLDNEPYRQAALQYYESAQRFYNDGDHGRGDYCILRGDTYLLLTSLATQVSTIGVRSRLDEKTAEHTSNAGTMTEKERKVKIKEIRQSLDKMGRLVPPVPIELADNNPCDYFHQQALAEADLAIKAAGSGNSDGITYHLHEAVLWDICEGICLEKLASPGSENF
jgi:hypothetical protein